MNKDKKGESKMNKKLIRVNIKPANYLSKTDIAEAGRLSRALYACKTTSEVESIERQLKTLIRKAAMIRSAQEHAKKLKQMSRIELEVYLKEANR
jgi:hypothetical protein